MHRIALGLRRACLWAAAICLSVFFQITASGQFIGSVEVRPFVTALIPVVGPGGAVGGVSIDARGALSRSDVESMGRLRDERLRAATAVPSELNRPSPLRKVSLRGLVQDIDRRRRAGLTVSEELQNLAGLSRVQYVFAYPEQGDLVIAGQAEGWQIDAGGNAIGRSSGRPVLQLDDFVVALRTAKAAAVEPGITCSIDPTEEGIKRLKPLLHSRSTEVNEALVSHLEETLGPQHITITGVPPRSHFARVLVASDFLMKRLGMGLEESPVEGLPSYLNLLAARTAPPPRGSMPRWWMTSRYEPLLRDKDGLAWEIRAGGVQVLSEELRSRGTTAEKAKRDTLSQKWADAMTSKFQALAKELPVFGELRNCMDLAVVTALITKEDLLGKTGCNVELLFDETRVAVAEYEVPQTVATTASLVRKGNGWIVSLSGGVEIDAWAALAKVEERPVLTALREGAKSREPGLWWWD